MLAPWHMVELGGRMGPDKPVRGSVGTEPPGKCCCCMELRAGVFFQQAKPEPAEGGDEGDTACGFQSRERARTSHGANVSKTLRHMTESL